MELGPVVAGAIVLGLVVTAIFFLAGYLTSGAPTSTLTIGAGRLGSNPSCAALCAAWSGLRGVACTAISISNAANIALAAATAAVNSATRNAALFLAAALVASFIPFIGPAIATAMFATYLLAQATVVFLLARQVSAAQVASSAATDVRTSLADAAAARAALVASCTNMETLSACLSMPSPCSSVP